MPGLKSLHHYGALTISSQSYEHIIDWVADIKGLGPGFVEANRRPFVAFLMPTVYANIPQDCLVKFIENILADQKVHVVVVSECHVYPPIERHASIPTTPMLAPLYMAQPYIDAPHHPGLYNYHTSLPGAYKSQIPFFLRDARFLTRERVGRTVPELQSTKGEDVTSITYADSSDAPSGDETSIEVMSQAIIDAKPLVIQVADRQWGHDMDIMAYIEEQFKRTGSSRIFTDLGDAQMDRSSSSANVIGVTYAR